MVQEWPEHEETDPGQGTRETEASRAEDEDTDEEDFDTNVGSISWQRSLRI